MKLERSEGAPSRGDGVFEPITLDQLTVFLAVLDARGFSAAARALGRVQSAVSHSVAALEEGLEIVLFDRRSRPPKPTESGLRLAAEARLVLAQARQLRQVAGTLREGLEPELHLAVDALYPVELLAERLRTFREQFPTVALRVQTDLMAVSVELVRDGAADLGVCNLADAEAPAALDALPAGRVELVPVCAPDHPLASEPAPQRADRLRHHVQVVLSERTRRVGDRGVLGERTWRVTDLATKMRLIGAGIGWGSLPRELVAVSIARGELIALEPEPWLDGRHRVLLHTVVRTDRPLGAAGSWLRRELTLGA